MANKALIKFRQISRNVRTSTTIGLWVCTGSAIGLNIASFLMPPTGAIDPSVLKAAGEIFAFAALLELREAILEGMGIKLIHGNTTIEVRDKDNEENGETPAETE